MGRRRVVAVAMGCIALGGVGAGALPAGAQAGPDLPAGPADRVCATAFPPGAFGGFLPAHKASPGEPVSVEVRWNAKEFSAANVELVSCVSQDGNLVGAAASRVAGVANDGGQRVAFVVPDGAKAGTNVCQRTAVAGAGVGGAPNLFRTDAVCYSVTAANASRVETPLGASEVKPTEVVPAATREVAGPSVVAGKTESRPAAAVSPASTPAPAPQAAAAPEALPRTGSAERVLLVSAGLLICAGGFAAMFGVRRAAG